MRQLVLLTVNGHPDDEIVNVGGVMARYAAEGMRVLCITATRGEVGEIVAKDLKTPENQAHLGELREQELKRGLLRLGNVEHCVLGYRDSGLMGSHDNCDQRSFWQANLDDAAGRLVQIIRNARADVIVAPNSFGGDGHPDHIRASEIARLAFERSGDPSAYLAQLQSSGVDIWAPSKLYEPV